MAAWALVLAIISLTSVPALAATGTPSFDLTTPQLQAGSLPASGSSLLFARFSRGEEMQRYALVLPAGGRVDLSVLQPWGRTPVTVVVLSKTGIEFALPVSPRPTRLWLGPLALARVSHFTLDSLSGGLFAVMVQKTGHRHWQPYALGVNWQGGSALGAWNWRSALGAPWRFLRGLVWWWT